MTNASCLFVCLFFYLSFASAQQPRLMPPFGHTGDVNTIAVSPDGKYVLSGADQFDNTVLLWTSEGRLIGILEGHQGDIAKVDIAPDGGHLLTLEVSTGLPRLWNEQGRLLRKYEGLALNDLCFAPDGNHFAGVDAGGQLLLYDLMGEVVREFNESGEPSFCRVAFSKDGAYLAAADGAGLVVVYHSDGREAQRLQIPELTDCSSLEFSPDGRQLLTIGADVAALLLNWREGSIASSSGERADEAAKVALSPDGQVIAVGLFNGVSLWTAEGAFIHRFITDQAFVNSLVFWPDGGSLLLGGDEPAVLRYDLHGQLTGRYASTSSAVSSVDYLQLSPDSTYLLTGGKAVNACLWDISAGRARSFPVQDAFHGGFNAPVAFRPEQALMTVGEAGDSLYQWDFYAGHRRVAKTESFSFAALAYRPDGQYFLTSDYTGGVQLWKQEEGNMIWEKKVPANPVTSLAFAPDGQTFLLARGDGALRGTSYLAVADGMPVDPHGSPASLHRLDDFSVVREFGSVADKVAFSPDGRYVATNENEELSVYRSDDGTELFHIGGTSELGLSVLSLAFAPDAGSVVAGYTNSWVRQYDLQGKLLREYKGHWNAVRALAFSPDGKYLITGSGDNTTKIWDTGSGREIVTLMAVGEKDWVVMSPDGLFDASAGAMDQLYFVSGLEIIELEQLKERYFEPGLLTKVFGRSPDPVRSVEAFTDVALYPEMKAQLSDDRLTLQVSLTPRSGGIGKLSLFVNGKEVREDANPRRAQAVTIDLTEYGRYYLPTGPSKLALRVYNADGWLKSQALELDYEPPAAAKGAGSGGSTGGAVSLLKKPSLYAIVIGTAQYAGDKLDLQFTDRDATYFSQALRIAAPEVYGDRVYVTLLNTDPNDNTRQDIASKASIKKAFDDVAAKAQAQDVLIVYCSGHGVTHGAAEQGQFYYLTKDIAGEDLSDPEIRRNYAVSSEEFTQWIKGIAALKQVMIIDACSSGRIIDKLSTGRKDLNASQIRALDRLKDRTGMFILTGSAADKVSYEASQYGQSLLTYSLLQGMSGPALTEDRRVDVMKLFQHARDQVPDLAKGIGGIQTPVLSFPNDGASFDIGIVNPGAKIPVAQVKPVFIRGVFQEESTFDDVIGLGPALAEHFRRLTVKGAQAELMYWDVLEHPNAYSIKGRYSISDNVVTVRGRLFKGKETIKEEFQLTGQKNDLPGLVEAILDKVSAMVQ